VAVNPDRDLRRTATAREWQVRWFKKPVQLRDRLPRPEVTPANGALIAGMVAAGLVAWWLARKSVERGRQT
jgi:hypothetical protein